MATLSDIEASAGLRRRCALLMAFAMAICLAVTAPTTVEAAAQQEDLELTARTLFAAGQYQRSLDLYAQLYAKTLHPTYLRNVGRCYQNLGEPEQAIRSFREHLRKAENLDAKHRAEVEGFIREMEELQRQRERRLAPPAPTLASPTATAATTATTATTATAKMRPVGLPPSYAGNPEPTLQASAAPSRTAPGGGALARWSVFLRADFAIEPAPGQRLLPGLAFAPVRWLDLGLAAVIGRDSKGAWAGGRVLVGTGRLRPCITWGVPVLFPTRGSTAPGVQGGGGAALDVGEHLRILADVTAAYFPTIATGAPRAWLIPSLSVQAHN